MRIRLQDAFERFDTNGDGEISEEEFRAGARGLDSGLSLQQIEDLLAVLEKTESGGVDYTEFSELFGEVQNKELAAKMTARWEEDPGMHVDRLELVQMLATEATLISDCWASPSSVSWPDKLTILAPEPSVLCKPSQLSESGNSNNGGVISALEYSAAETKTTRPEWSDAQLHRLLHFDASLVLGTASSAPDPAVLTVMALGNNSAGSGDGNGARSAAGCERPGPESVAAPRLPTETLSAQLALGRADHIESVEEASHRREMQQRQQHAAVSAPWRVDSEGWRRAAAEEAALRNQRQKERAKYSRWCFDNENRRVTGRTSPFLAACEGKKGKSSLSSSTPQALSSPPGLERQAAMARHLFAKVQDGLARAKERLGVSVMDDPGAVFDAFDTDKSGALDRNELAAAFLKVGAEDLSVSDIRDIVEFCDTDGDGTIDKSEFMLLVGATKF